MENLSSDHVPEEAIIELKKLLTTTRWKYHILFGGSDDIKPCIRIRFNTEDDTPSNPLLKYKINDEFITFGGVKIKAYQAAFVAHHQRLPEKSYQISHVCGLPLPRYRYKVGWSPCIEPEHMIVEKAKYNSKRKRCHLFIRIFKSAIMTNKIKNTTETVTVRNLRKNKEIKIRKFRLKVIKRIMRGSKKYINSIVDHTCNCTQRKCFINWGGRQYQTAVP